MKRLAPQFRRRVPLGLLYSCVVTVIALLLSEGLLRVLVPTTYYYIWTPYRRMVFMPRQEIMPGISGPSRFVVNSWGVRADPLSRSDTYRILAIGGSTTECLFLDQTEAWPYLLQEELHDKDLTHRVWVGNAGLSGKTTRHHLTAMHNLPLGEMRIDAIVMLIGVNDLMKRLSQDDAYDPDFLSRPEAKTRLLEDTFAGLSVADADVPFFKKTAVWRQLTTARRAVMSRRSPNTIQDGAGEIYVTWREHRRRAAEVRDRLPDLSSALAEYSRNVSKIVDVATARAIRVILVTQPTMWKPGLREDLEALLWAGGIGNFQVESGNPYYSAGALERGMKQYNDATLRICRERQLDCLDLSPTLEKDTTVFYDDAHFNEIGARKVAGALSKFLLNKDILRPLFSRGTP